MSDSQDGVKAGLLLQGKNNFIVWQREFERQARAKDFLKYLKGDVKAVKEEPQARDSVVYTNLDGGTTTRSQAANQ
ncbi:MAG: hypothetical protein M1823_007901, partial [Watsoniomyces obsoletus]